MSARIIYTDEDVDEIVSCKDHRIAELQARVRDLRGALVLAIASAENPQPHTPADLEVCRKTLEAARAD